MSNSKTIKRSKFIGLEALNFAIRPIHTSLVSLLVIRLIDIELWGQFVFYIVGLELITMFLNWGQKAYLMREFSLHPKSISRLFWVTILARLPLFVGAIVVLIIVPDFRLYFWSVLAWLTFKWLANMFEAIVQFNRTYWQSIIAELLALVTALSYLLYQSTVSLNDVIFAFAIASTVRFVILLPLLKDIKLDAVSWNDLKSNLKATYPIFALTLAGLLQTKGDLYTATYFLDDVNLAQYQVIISFLVIGQTMSWIIMGPFQKNIFRWKEGNIEKLKKQYLLIGGIVTAIFSTALFFGLKLVYQINLEYWYVFLFFAYIFPLYFYLIESQLLLKYKLENCLLKFNIIAAIISIGLSILLIPSFGIEGALVSGIICRWVLTRLIVKEASTLTNKE